ncbi:hypothetical protein ACMAUO_20485 [Gluconacetobacter sp. Hr-1-5]|uniref:hypothetical protein n=1 Tax=Gluconacetobacter sp. Hr-1-5 TaxID=3395370 RepID=UPI003B51CA16
MKKVNLAIALFLPLSTCGCHAGTPVIGASHQAQAATGRTKFSSVTFDDSIIAKAFAGSDRARPDISRTLHNAYSGFVPLSNDMVSAIQRAIDANPAGVYHTKSLVFGNVRNPGVMQIGMSLDVVGIQTASSTMQIPDVHTIALASDVASIAVGQAFLTAIDTTKVLPAAEKPVIGMHGHRVWVLAIPELPNAVRSP